MSQMGCVHVYAVPETLVQWINCDVPNEIRLLLETFTFCPIYITVLPNMFVHCARLVSNFLTRSVRAPFIPSNRACVHAHVYKHMCVSEYAYILVLFICTFSVTNFHITKSPYSAIGHFVSNPMTSSFGYWLGCFCLALQKIGNIGHTFVLERIQMRRIL